MSSHDAGFIGRRRELEQLTRLFETVRRSGRGRLVSVRGRRQAGKSRLITEFADRSGLPQLYFTATKLATAAAELSRFGRVAARSDLAAAGVFGGVTPDDPLGALTLLAAAIGDKPAIVVLDEFPWLTQSIPETEGALQVAWDRLLENRPVLMFLIGSDISMMEALSAHDRPLFGKVREFVVDPFTVADTAAMAGIVDPAVAIDAQLVTGGYPRLCLEWHGAPDVSAFVAEQLGDDNTDLIVTGRNILAAEFPAELQARRVLSAIGAGSRTNKAIADLAGIQAAPLARSLDTLGAVKRMIAVDVPVSVRRARAPRYRIADPYLRFWLRFVEPALPDIARGRPDLALDRVREAWVNYRGRAVEPLVHASLERIALADERLGGAAVIGGYWTRTGDVEVDVVGVDRWPDARRVPVIGSVKWREHGPFDRRDAAALAAARSDVPGADQAVLVAVSRSGCTAADLDAVYGPAELVAAWR